MANLVTITAILPWTTDTNDTILSNTGEPLEFFFSEETETTNIYFIAQDFSLSYIEATKGDPVVLDTFNAWTTDTNAKILTDTGAEILFFNSGDAALRTHLFTARSNNIIFNSE